VHSSDLYSRKNLEFLLFEVLNLDELKKDSYFEHHDKETINFVLDAAAEIAKQVLWPSYMDADRNAPELEEGRVAVHPSVHQFIKSFSDAGFISADFSEAWGGIHLPKTVFAALDHILGSANNSLVMYTGLVRGVGHLIDTFGSEQQKKEFLPSLLSGQYLGTMCLTEPEAGSALSAIKTKAVEQADGTFTISGQKIFISAGDHDVTANIIHLVLARIEGAPAGTKGISLFIVPKLRKGKDGSIIPNDVTSIGIYHKMGQQATPAMHLAFGAEGDCVGFLLGQENQGLPQMFQMMNAARMDVGIGSVNIASAAYQKSLKYARERRQGKRPGVEKSGNDQVPIIKHADVRRLLLSQKSFVEGTLSFLLQCAFMLDLEKIAESTSEKNEIIDLLELLTPAAKAYASERGIISVNEGLQVLGGAGYTRDFPLEQMARDVRIMSIYEGTTAIQSLAILGRQIIGKERKSLDSWFKWVRKDLDKVIPSSETYPYRMKLENQLERFSQVTDHILEIEKTKGLEQSLMDATLYQQAFGILNVAWQWIKQGIVAEAKLGESLSSDDSIFYRSKIQTLKFFFHYELPRLDGLWVRLEDPEVLTLFDSELEVII